MHEEILFTKTNKRGAKTFRFGKRPVQTAKTAGVTRRLNREKASKRVIITLDNVKKQIFTCFVGTRQKINLTGRNIAAVDHPEDAALYTDNPFQKIMRSVTEGWKAIQKDRTNKTVVGPQYQLGGRQLALRRLRTINNRREAFVTTLLM